MVTGYYVVVCPFLAGESVRSFIDHSIHQKLNRRRMTIP